MLAEEPITTRRISSIMDPFVDGPVETRQGRREDRDRRGRRSHRRRRRDDSYSANSDSEADGEERAFRLAEGKPGGQRWADVMAKALKYPGVLAARSLQKMEWACGRNSAKQGTYDHRRAPPEAMNYY